MLDENTATYLSNSVATSGGTTNLGNNLSRHHSTFFSKSQTSNNIKNNNNTSVFLLKFVRILDYYLLNSCSYSYLFW